MLFINEILQLVIRNEAGFYASLFVNYWYNKNVCKIQLQVNFKMDEFLPDLM